MSGAHDRVREVFHACCELPEGEWAGALDRLCEGDAALRAEVESLLRFDRATDVLSDEAIDSVSVRGSLGGAGDLPECVGEYRILGLLGEGGTGVVYEAEQESPRRRVALKVLRHPLLTESMRRRFVREAEVVGRLQHPGIAQVYAAVMGERAGGAPPHIAMELVRGKPLTEAASTLPLRERLALFCEVCDAVRYAHEMGVVHRDLKPANILVDAERRVKVVDFGVARLTDPDMLTVTAQTHAGQIVGTIPYMSPEQITGDVGSVCEATDVYGLGAVLFEVLTGALPHDVRGRSIPEAARIISEDEPTRLGTHDRSLRGDLELIVATALEHRREDRYATAGELAADIRRYLASEPISARPHSASYQLAKFARRNKAVVVSAALLMLVMAAATAVSMVFGFRQYDARRDAEAANQEASEQAAIAERVNDFLVNDLLGAVHPVRARGEEVTVRAVLDETAARLAGGELNDQPAVARTVHATIGSSYRALAMFPEAESHLRRTLELCRELYGDSDRRTGTAWSDLGGLLRETDNLEEAKEAYGAALKAYRECGDADDVRISTVMENLALVLKTMGRYEEAERRYLECLDIRRTLGPEHESLLAVTHHNLGSLYRSLERYPEAAQQLEAALEIRKRLREEDHPELAFTAGTLASVLDELGRLDEAEEYLDYAQGIFERVYGPTHPYVATSITVRAGIAQARGDTARAIELYQKAADLYAESLGETHHFFGMMQSSIGQLLAEQGDYAAARPRLERAIAIFEDSLPLDHPNRGEALAALGRIELEEGNRERAIGMLEESLPILLRVRETSPDTVACRLALAEAYLAGDRVDEARAQLEAARGAVASSPEELAGKREQLEAMEARLP